MRRHLLLILLGFLIVMPAFADSGMWTFQDFPHGVLKSEHGVDVSSAWLDRVRTATIRLSNCHCFIRIRAGTDPHQPPLLRGLPR